MHNFVKYLLFLPIICLCACTDGINIKTEKSEYSTGGALAVFELPVIECSQNQDFADVVTKEFAQEAEVILADFLAKEALGLEANTKIAKNDGRIISIILEGEVETGKAHGEKFRRARTYDFAESKAVSLNDLFDGDSWRQMANNKMKELAERGEGDYADLWEVPSVELLQEENFYTKDGSLVLYFPPYELSYYRRGYVEFEFEKEELSSYLSEYGREIL